MTCQKSFCLTAPENGRLDKALASAAQNSADGAGLSRVHIQRLIREGRVTYLDRPILDPKSKTQKGNVYRLELLPPEKATPSAEDIPLSVLFEDEDLLVIDKQAGLVVHPAAGHRQGTLVNALLAHCKDSLSGIGGVARPGIVHRLDKETSGLMVVAKNDAAHQALARQFSDRSLSRVYQAIVWGVPAPSSGEIEGAIGRHPRARQKMAVVVRGGKAALTRYRLLEAFGAKTASLVECRLATGRTHQIRVHMAHLGHAVVGDPLYGPRGKRNALCAKGEKELVALLNSFPRQALFAGEISFFHPRTGKKMRFVAPMPKDMEKLLKALKKKKT